MLIELAPQRVADLLLGLHRRRRRQSGNDLGLSEDGLGQGLLHPLDAGRDLPQALDLFDVLGPQDLLPGRIVGGERPGAAGLDPEAVGQPGLPWSRGPGCSVTIPILSQLVTMSRRRSLLLMSMSRSQNCR
ncbi:MAG: hypothetical protein ACLGI9_22735 [Thermoanaerobaculia bacterium]